MQDSEKRKGSDDGAPAQAAFDEADSEATDTDAEDEAATSTSTIVPTKTEDGGSTNQEQAHANQNQGQVQHEHQETTSSRHDAFSIYSDDDTRMRTLLGLGEGEDWRQLTGFTGLGRRRINVDRADGTNFRRTRLSYELHYQAFVNMWIELGAFDRISVSGDAEQEPRQQQQDGKEDSSQKQGNRR